MIVYTGIDSNRQISVDYNPITKKWRVSKKAGKAVCVVSALDCLVKVLPKTEEKEKDLLQRLKREYSTENVDLKFYKDLVFVGVYRDRKECQEIDLEPFALARVLSLLTLDGGCLNAEEGRLTVVAVQDGVVSAFRVIKRKEGQDHRELLEFLGIDIGGKEVLLSGAYWQAFENLFQRVLKNPYCSPELTCALGASLKHIVKTPYPTFTKVALSPKEIKGLSVKTALAVLPLFASFFLTNVMYDTEKLRESARREFKEVFPNLPAVGVYQQVRSRVLIQERFVLTKRLARLSGWEGLTIYSIEWDGEVLRIKGEGPQDKVIAISTQSTKKAEENTLEFEAVLK